jgi:HEAT repeat protein
MRSLLTALFTLFLIFPHPTLAAQHTPETPEEFATADDQRKGQALVQLIRHQGSVLPETVVAIIRLGLSDPNKSIREGALSAVMSRAAGPQFSRDTAVATDWIADHEHVRSLRPQINAALHDPDETLREAAISALVSLEFDIATGRPELSGGTDQLLVSMYYADKSGRVRAKIVGGLATDQSTHLQTVGKLLIDAFDDPDARVRQAASYGADKLDRDVALPLLVRQLEDVDHSVRGQSASVLIRYGATAAHFLPQIEQALARERDAQVRGLLQIAVSMVKR